MELFEVNLNTKILIQWNYSIIIIYDNDVGQII